MSGGDARVELLERAGLEAVGERRVEEVLPPPFAWSHVVGWEVRPTAKVAADRTDLVAEINAQWHRLARETGILDTDGTFLVDAGGPSRQWRRVRLTADWDLAGVLGERPGQPEFLTLSPDGDTLLGVTTEEYEVWLVAVDRIRERREEVARAAGRETAEERAAAWESLFRRPRPVEKLLDVWANGLSLNPAVPEDLRPRLTRRSSYAMYGALPAEAVDAALADPDWRVRSRAVQDQPHITADQWARVILGERDERQRWLLTMIAADRAAELDEGTCRRLAADPSSRVRGETARLGCLPVALARALVADPDDRVRAVACQTAWPHLDAAARASLVDGPPGYARSRSRLLHHREHPMPRPVFEALEERDLQREALETCLLSRDLAEHLARHGDADERRSLARNPAVDPDLVALLGQDADVWVRNTVAQRADLTEEQRAGIDFDFDPAQHSWALDWIVALHEDEDAMRRLAASAHPLVRRSVARARHLPPDVVARLARDEDRVVQLFLAESCDDAPADMLLEVWQWWDGGLTTPDRPRGHPNFPRHDLLRYADDPRPRMRRLALDDPESTPELVERLSRDASEEVRYRAAADPRLSATAAARLLEDPHEHIRLAAALHPRLPARLLVRLLTSSTGNAEAAARNPGLPVEVMHRMVELLGSETPDGGGSETGPLGE
ncbi:MULTISPECIES: PE-PGRS family protein [unclassified Streptomyces]|uniref:PE-PGRS family protein n=1 Tax=unclassified Streptomyces TaxID=2593676 RepID=UPI0036E51EA5